MNVNTFVLRFSDFFVGSYTNGETVFCLSMCVCVCVWGGGGGACVCACMRGCVCVCVGACVCVCGCMCVCVHACQLLHSHVQAFHIWLPEVLDPASPKQVRMLFIAVCTTDRAYLTYLICVSCCSPYVEE